MLIEFLRDVAVLAAATGVAWWAWREYAAGSARMDEAAKAQIASDRRATDLLQIAQRLEQQMSSIGRHMSELAVAEEATRTRWNDKLRVHQLLQSTTDPFLSFAEIEQALSGVAASQPEQDVTEGSPPSGDRLRRAIIELVGDGVIAQLDKDRYFIASDFEANEADAADTSESSGSPRDAC